MRELTMDEVACVAGGDDESCTVVATATTAVVSTVVGYYASPLTLSGSTLLGLGTLEVYSASESLCEYYTTPQEEAAYSLGPVPLPYWMMSALPWPYGETE